MLIADLVRGAGLTVVVTAGATGSALVESVHLCETPEAIAGLPVGGLALLGERAGGELVGYRLDLVVRLACDRGLAALVVCGLETVPTTADRLARRGQLAVLGLPAGGATGDLLLRLDRAMHPQPAADLARLAALEGLLHGWSGGDEDVLLAAASGAYGRPLVGARGSRGPVEPAGGAVADRIAARLVGGLITTIREQERREQERLVRATTRLIAELLGPAGPAAVGAVDAARRRGVAVEGEHVVAVTRSSAEPLTPRAVELAEDLARLATAEAGRSTGWLIGVVGDALAVIRTTFDEPGTGALRALCEQVHERAAESHPELRLATGIGGAHAGPDGPRASGAEAETALRVAAAGPASIVVHDATGVRRAIGEWSVTAAGARAIDAALAPLDALGERRASVAVATLAAWLDAQGSNVTAGRSLHLHPNAVAYRLRRIRAALASDITDPDERLMLQIACRARLLAGGASIHR